METIANLPRSISGSVQQTFQTYTPLLFANAEKIKSTRCETFTYGSHERQKLDVYYPTQRRRPSVSSANVPVLIFLYGEGLVRGAKRMAIGDGLVHANVGHFFTEKFGYTTVIPDYRLMEHGARFPSGGEDLAQVIQWIREQLCHQDGYSAVDLFIVGNSAGGVHLSTYLFASDFAASRSKIITSDTEAKVVLRGVVLLSVPFNFQKADPSRTEVLAAYFGDNIQTRCPQGLLRTALLQDPDTFLPNIRTMVLNGTLDPEDEILEPKEDFLNEWAELDKDGREALIVAVMEGQNHISPPLSLGTGIEEEEAWGRQVGDFIESLRS